MAVEEGFSRQGRAEERQGAGQRRETKGGADFHRKADGVQGTRPGIEGRKGGAKSIPGVVSKSRNRVMAGAWSGSIEHANRNCPPSLEGSTASLLHIGRSSRDVTSEVGDPSGWLTETPCMAPCLHFAGCGRAIGHATKADA